MLISLLIKILYLNLLILFIIIFKIYTTNSLSKSFNRFFIYFIFLVIVNFYVMVFNNFYKCILLLVLISFYSMFLVIMGYGSGYKIKIIILFKSISDIFIFLIMSNSVFSVFSYSVGNSLFILDYKNEFFILIIFCIYSLIGVFGFWIYWAMDANYFTSSFLHSCGFIAVGVILFNKLTFTGVLSPESHIYNYVNYFSLISYVFFLMFSVVLKDLKKSFGLYSSSSICFLFWSSINYPLISVSYFFLSSLLKIMVFEVLFHSNKSSNSLFLTILLISFLNFNMFFLFYGISLDLLLLFLLKFLYLFIFMFKVILFNSFFRFNFIFLILISIRFNYTVVEYLIYFSYNFLFIFYSFINNFSRLSGVNNDFFLWVEETFFKIYFYFLSFLDTLLSIRNPFLILKIKFKYNSYRLSLVSDILDFTVFTFIIPILLS